MLRGCDAACQLRRSDRSMVQVVDEFSLCVVSSDQWAGSHVRKFSYVDEKLKGVARDLILVGRLIAS